jgi:uncharacterized membrane protein YphA (DoxX/SURF4 family)
MNLPIPIQVLYAGLAGTVLALLIAAAMNRWSIRVFLLLSLRLAIGWHFLFEGLYKVNSHFVGVTESNRPFTSEPYFRNAPGPVAAYMRKQFNDPAATIADRVSATKTTRGEAFANLAIDEQAAACPASVARQLDEMEARAVEAVKAEAAKELVKADADEAAVTKNEKKTDDEKKKARESGEKARQEARKKDETATQIAQQRIIAAKAEYARWIHGAEGRPVKFKHITGDLLLTAPQRVEHMEWLRRETKAADDLRAANLGNGAGIEQKRAAELRTELITAESDLARDADAFVAELKKWLNGDKDVEPEGKPRSRGEWMDIVTMWFLVAVGACLMAGLFTRLSCLLAAGFLVVVYLGYPPPPFYPLPPNSASEGNPVFINKNVIEFLALLVLATFPTGRWMGLDALIARMLGHRYADAT